RTLSSSRSPSRSLNRRPIRRLIPSRTRSTRRVVRPELERRLAVLVEPLERAVLDGVREFEADPGRTRVELGLVPVFADERPLVGLAGLIDWRSSGRLSAVLRSGFF